MPARHIGGYLDDRLPVSHAHDRHYHRIPVGVLLGRHYLYRYTRPTPGQEHRRAALDHTVETPRIVDAPPSLRLSVSLIRHSRGCPSFPRRRESSCLPCVPQRWGVLT